ncbi:MAG TPA: bifunctional phosphoribosyl-AMP cyclohydrolase/phosphoribosyl-ATP diphosphatase HisIE [Wenzhouxiangella sp.]|nr:bifunctional phosphoribosyl-AMP cyclohydrolase/phosphoribosyl-ATP diphosphatase HisIE [Wenzhouxiangella sp.]
MTGLDWNRAGGLLPAVVQHWQSGQVLMLGYMNRQALAATRSSGRVTFWSRSRQCLWTKGETSGNILHLKGIYGDCDADAILVLARPQGPTCHLGRQSCFGNDAAPQLAFLHDLDQTIAGRRGADVTASYTARLLNGPRQRLAQKVGEEGVETALAAVAGSNDALLDESADLLYHLLVLLESRGLGLGELVSRLAQRA